MSTPETAAPWPIRLFVENRSSTSDICPSQCPGRSYVQLLGVGSCLGILVPGFSRV